MYSSIKNKSYLPHLSPNYTHLAMSQQPNEINDINDINDNINDRGDNHDENHRPNLEDFVMASVMLPIARANILDYLYASGIPLRPIQLGGGGGAVDMDGVASILANSLYDRRPVKTVVDEKGMAELSEKIFTAQLAEELKINTVCGIWQDDFEEGERIKILPCNHAFKVDAIDKWLTTEKAECPICRFSLSSKEVNCGHVVDEYHVRDGGGEAMVVDDAPDEHDFQPNIAQINENHIAARLADNIQNRLHRDDSAPLPPRIAHGQYAVPINQLLQSRRNMINNIARVSGGARGGLRWPPVAAAAAAPAPVAAAQPDHEPEQGGAVANNNYPYINNIYYFNNIINNNHGGNDNNISDRERDDIQEAIRRSLQEQ
jgi:hypothetical protein